MLGPLRLSVADLFDDPLPDRRDAGATYPLPRRAAPRSSRSNRRAGSGAGDATASRATPAKAPKKDLGARLSSTHVVSYLYRVQDPGPDGPGYLERVDRHEVAHERGSSKSFRRWHWDGQRWCQGKISTLDAALEPVLFNWPGVQRAVAAGDEVWLVEGEKDALTLIELGLCATTNISGASSWSDAYTEALRGARVVLCLDRDAAGWKRGEKLAAALYPVTKALRVVQPPAPVTGDGEGSQDGEPGLKDVTDLVEAGRVLSDLEQLDLGRVIDLGTRRRERETGAGDAGGGGGVPPRRDGDGTGLWDHIPNTRPTYLYRQGAIVEKTWRRSGDDAEPRFSVIIDAKAEILRSTYLDNGSVGDSPPVHDHVVRVWREDPVTGEVVEEGGTYRIPADEVANARWPERIPMRNLIVGKKRAERDKAWDALEWVTADAQKLKPGQRNAVPVYCVPGWRQTSTGPIYVHGGGAIGAGGAVEAETQFDSEFGGMTLPAPTRDVEVLAEAWRVGMEPLLEMPARIIAPLLGVTMWASLCGPATHVTHLIGQPGTQKSNVIRSVLQLFHPQLQNAGEHQEMASARNSRPIALSRLLSRAKDTVLLIDDFAPDDEGGAAAAAAKLAALARIVHNRSKRSKSARFGEGTDSDPAPRGTLITSGELAAAGSAETRCLNVPVADGDLNGEGNAKRIENPRTAAARGLLGASFLSWAAGQLDDLQGQVRSWTWGDDSYQEVWAARLRDLPHNSGVRARIANGVATSSAGIRVLHDWLIDAGVLSAAQGAALWEWAIAGLDEVARSQDVDATDPGVHLLTMLREVIGSRYGHLADHRGDAPHPEDLDFAASYGWSWQPRPGMQSMSGAPLEVGQWVKGGVLLGEITADEVKLLPGAVLGAVRAAAARSDQRWGDTLVSLSAAMDARGWLKVSQNSAGARERRPSVRVCGTKTRAWVLPRWVLDGDGPEDDRPDGPQPGPLPRLDPADRTPDGVGVGSAGPVETPVREDLPVLVPAAAHTAPAAPSTEGPVAVPVEREIAADAAADDVDLDVDPVTSEEYAMRLAELVEHLARLGGHPLDHVPTATIPSGPCSVCEESCSLTVGGARVHLRCLLEAVAAAHAAGPAAESPAQAAAAAAVAGEGEEVVPEPSPRPAPAAAQLPRPGAPAPWKYAAAVLDTSGAYLPDGRRVGAGAVEHAGQVLAVGERLQVGHPAAPGQLWLTEALCEQLGLLADPDPDVCDPDEQRRQALERLAAAGESFLAPAVQAGWRVDGGVLRPLTKLRRAGVDGGRERVLELVVEPYQWVWDPRGTGLAGGEDGKPTALPDIADPAARWSELARRAGRAAELLGVPFRMSAGLVGADLFDVAQRRRRRAAERGPAVDRAGRNRARVVDRAGVLPAMRGHRKGLPVEQPLAWSIPVADEVLDRAEFAHGFDVRKQWLAAAKSVELGYCTDQAPELVHHDVPEQIRALVAGVSPAKLPFGMWRVALPAWDEPRLPAPHPRQRRDEPVRLWVSTPTLRLLLEESDTRHGVGYDLVVLDPDEAWTWPEQGRLLDGLWYETLRDALEASKTDPAMEAHVKAVYAGYFGRLSSASTASSARPWHHQPAWQQAIIAAARAEEWRKIHRAAFERNVWPVVVTADEVVYLAGGQEAANPAAVAPAADNGRVGALRHSRSLPIDDAVRARLHRHGGDLVRAGVWTHLVGREEIDLDEDPGAAGAASEQTGGGTDTKTGSEARTAAGASGTSRPVRAGSGETSERGRVA